MSSYEASAPANIALIKYMGKSNAKNNSPSNSSFSWSLEDLRTFVRITEINEDKDRWAPLNIENAIATSFSQKSLDRYLSHFNYLKNEWGIKKKYLVESANTFPSDCGLASSASSFAALTLAAAKAFQVENFREEIGASELSEYSRKGSGSSCRSFFGPWVLWSKEGTRPLEFPYTSLAHQVVVVGDKKKEVSSSEAHQRVVTSYLFQGRTERAERRMAELLLALNEQKWQKIFEICWAEFWDMHSLFETSSPPFGYMQPESLEVLEYAKQIWSENQDGPVVTMDAGANVHFLWRTDQLKLAKIAEVQLQKKFKVFSCRQLNEVNI
jgi:diphosphomevalonate decarboxylase